MDAAPATPAKPAAAHGTGSGVPQPSAGKPGGCAGVGAAVLRLFDDRMLPGDERSKAMAARIADAHAKHCATDRWAAGVAACIAAAQSQYAMSSCASKLTRDQQWRLAGDTSPLAMGAMKEPKATASAHPDPACAAAAGHAVDGFVASTNELIELISEDRRAADRAHFQKVAPFMKTALTRVCSDDKWPADTITCLDAARSDYEMGMCAKQLPDAQRGHVQSAIAAAVGTPDHFP